MQPTLQPCNPQIARPTSNRHDSPTAHWRMQHVAPGKGKNPVVSHMLHASRFISGDWSFHAAWISLPGHKTCKLSEVSRTKNKSEAKPKGQTPAGCGSKLNHQGTAGCSPSFHLPGFHFGYIFLTHSQLVACCNLWLARMSWNRTQLTEHAKHRDQVLESGRWTHRHSGRRR